MIPFHTAWVSYDAQGRPIDPTSVGDLYWEGWSLFYTGPNDGGLIYKPLGAAGPTQMEPTSVVVSGFDSGAQSTGYIATAAPLVGSDTNGVTDVFYLNSAGTQLLTAGDGPSGNPQYLYPGANGFGGGVAFESAATNLVAADANGASDIFVRQAQTGGSWLPAERVSVTTTGAEANGASYGLVAADWRPTILFSSDATNLVGDGQGGLFWKDLGTGVLKRADSLADGTRLAGVGDADISAYGRYVVFTTASAGAPGDTNGVADVFLKDIETGALTRVSTASDGSQLSFAAANPTIDPDGRYVAFEGQGQVWVKDVQTGELLKLTDTPGANHVVGFQGTQLLFRADGGGVLDGVSTGGLFVATVGDSAPPLRSGVTATSTDFVIPDGIEQAFIRSDIGGYTITGNALANYFRGTPVGNTFIGGAGDDVFDMDRAGNTLTGGAGFDIYIGVATPYAPQTITDFRIGEDEINLDRALAGRGGSDPTVDGCVRLLDDGAGGTRILFDPDGFAGSAAANPVFVLQNIPVSTATWANLTDREGPGADHTPVLSQQAGGAPGQFFYASVDEALLPSRGPQVSTGSMYVRATDGVDDLTVGGHAVITDGVFQTTSWTTALGSRIEFVGYDPTNGKVTFNYTLLTKQYHPYAGGLGDNYLYDDMAVRLTDRDGDAATGTLRPQIRDDEPSASSDLDIVDRNAGRSSGNVIRGVRDADSQYSSGIDHIPVDGGAIGRIDIASTGVADDTPDADGNFVITGSFGILTMNLNGDYTYVLRSDAPSTGSETFRYWLKDGDGRPLHENTSLQIRFSPDAAGSGGGQVITSPGPGSTVTGGPGDDTLNASNGADTLTGAGGSDVFAWAQAPTATARVVDFRVDYGAGGDHIDLSKVLQTLGYTGADPVADGWVKLVGLDGGTGIVLDRDGPGPGDVDGQAIIKLDNVPETTPWAYIGGAGYVYYWASPGTLARPEGNSGATDFTFTITRNNGGAAGEGAVTWATFATGANPATGSDFVGGALPTGTVTFAAGETTKTVTIQVAGDTVQEPEETFQVRLTSSTGGGIQDYRPTGYIGNDDGSAPPPPPADGGRVITSPAPGSTLTGGSGADTFNASQGSDILTGGGGADVFRWGKEPWSPATVTDFAVGSDRLDLSALFQASGYTGTDPVADKYISLTQQGSDTLVLFDRDATGTGQQWPNYIIKLQGVTGATWSQLAAGGDGTPPPPTDAQLSIRVVEPNHLEGNSGTVSLIFAVERTGATGGTSTVQWSVAGAGTYAADAADFGGSLPMGSLTFAPGETYKTVVVDAVGDTAVEQDEGFSVALTGASGATIVTGSARGMILNDDQVPPGDGGGRVITGTDTPSTLTGTTGADTITAGRSSDTIVSGDGADLLVFRYLPWRGSTVTDFKVGVDRLDFGQLFRDAGYTGSDPEGDGLISYKYQSGLQIYFDPDGSGTGQWPFLITTLQGVPSNTYRWAELSGSGGAPTGGATLGFGPNAGSGTFTEGSSGARTLGFGVHRSGDTSGAASVEWSVTGVGANPADAADFGGTEMPHGVVNFAPGEVFKNVVLTVVGDTDVEPDEQFAVDLSNPQGATLSGVIRTVQTMTNDDGATPPPPPPSGDGQVLTASRNGDTLTGGAGADTLNASQGPDRLTGGGGDDHFVFGRLVWNAGMVTDFAPGHDQVDLSGLFDAYPGGVVETRLNAGATEVYFDPDGAGGEWPSRITTLSGVTPDQLGSDWLIR